MNKKSVNSLRVQLLVAIILTMIGIGQVSIAQEIENNTSIAVPPCENISPQLQSGKNYEDINLILTTPPQNYSLSLEESLNLALENNSQFNIVKKQSEIYRLEARKTALDFLPDLNTSMSYSYNTSIVDVGAFGPTFFPGGGAIDFTGFIVQEHVLRQNAVSITEQLTDIYRTYHRKKVADITFESALLDEEISAENLTLNVYQTYFDILTSKLQLTAIDKNIAQLQAHKELAQAKVNEGTALIRDVQKVDLELERAEYDRFEMNTNLCELINKMKYLIGINNSDCYDIKIPDRTLEMPCSREEAVQLALENNPKLEQLDLATKIAQHNKKQEYGNYIPDVSVSASYVNQGGNEFLPKNNLVLGLNVNYNFFDWTKREITIKEKQLQIEQARLNYKDYTEQLKVEVDQKYNDILKAEELSKVYRKAIELARSNVDISSNRYQVGFAIITDVLSDQAELAQAQTNYYQAIYDRQKAIVSLKQSIGILLPCRSK